MSFFDDASLVFLPSGQAGKDGKAYSMKPVEELGSELVTNGDFTNGSSNWSTYTSGSSNVVFSDDVATINIDGSNSNVGIYQENVFSSGVQYRIVLRAKGTSSFDTEVVESQAAATQQVISSFSLTTSYQDFVFTHTANGTNDIFIHRLFSASGANESIIIDNVSIREVVVGDGDFTFSRGSNLTATRVDSNGLIEKGRENLLLQSNQFDTTWTTTSSITLTSGQNGYDGSNDAWLLERTSTGGQRVAQTISSSGVQTYSVYAKANVGDWLYMRCNTSGSPVQSWYDLSNGVIGTSSNTIDTKIESIASGWYRCSISFIASTTEVRLYPTDGDNSNDGTNESIYIQDAQLEQGLVATEYIESGASTGLAGILEDSPRFDYSGGASCPSLLLEPSRTNLAGYSEYIEGNTSQGFTNATKEGFAESPEGLNNAYEINVITPNENAAYDLGRFNTNIGADYTYSVYLKSSGTFDARIYAARGTTEIKNIVVTSEWQRFDLTFTSDNADKDLIVGFGDFNFSNPAQTISIYGLQFEQGSYPTSYIPNHSGGSVTRDADVNTLLNQSGVIGQTEGTILFDAYFDEAEKVNFSISDSSVSNFISIETTSSNEVTAKVEQGGSTQATITTTTSFFAEGDRLKCAIAYDSRDMAFYMNGTQVNTAAPNLIPTCDDVRFSNYDGSIKADQRVNQVLLFTTRISDNNLATLTS